MPSMDVFYELMVGIDLEYTCPLCGVLWRHCGGRLRAAPAAGCGGSYRFMTNSMKIVMIAETRGNFCRRRKP